MEKQQPAGTGRTDMPAVAFCPFFLSLVADAYGSCRIGWASCMAGVLPTLEHSAEVPDRWGPVVLAVDGEEQRTWSPSLWLPAASSAAVLY